MAEITLEKLHTLLQSLAEYVMTNVATRQELDQTRQELLEKLDRKADKTDIVIIADSVARLQIDMRDVKATQQTMINSMDAQAKQLDIIRTEQVAFSRAIDRHEERIAVLEGDKTDYRIKETGDSKYEGKKK